MSPATRGGREHTAAVRQAIESVSQIQRQLKRDPVLFDT